jgi:ACS family hexuronate transporter-like MFS transporter
VFLYPCVRHSRLPSCIWSTRLCLGCSTYVERPNHEEKFRRQRLDYEPNAIYNLSMPDQVEDSAPSAEAHTQPVSTKPATSYRWVIMALAFIVIVINYMDRSAISYAIGPIKAEFHLRDEDFGFISSAFGIGYLVMTLGGGIIVDLWGARKAWTWAAVAWSAVTGGIAVVTGFWPLFFMRTMLGVTEGPCFPAMTRTVTDWLPMSERARSTAFGLAAVPLASVIGAPVISHLIVHLGWKMMFVILGSLGLVWAAVWHYAFRDYPENSKHVSPSELEFIREGRESQVGKSDEEIRSHHLGEGKTTWRFMLLNPSLMANNYAFFSFGYLLFFAISWLPGFLQQTFHLQLVHAGELLMVPWLTATFMLAGAGWISDYLWRKTGSIRIARSHMIWICQLLSALCFIPIVIHPESLTVAMIFLSLGVGFGMMPNSCFYALNSDLAGDRAGTSLGLMDCFLAAAGILAPSITGWLVTATGNFNFAFILMIAFTLTSVLGIIFFQHPDRDMERLRALS